MEYAIEARGLIKNYGAFRLDGIDVFVPKGSIMGLIGDNGAGKTTLIKLLLNLIKRDGGSIKMLGLDPVGDEKAFKAQVGVVFDECCWSELLRPCDIDKILKNIYKTWSSEKYYSLLGRLSVPEKKPIKEFSRGMKMKLSIAAALGHSPKLLLLDEATGGLDPIVRNEILDIFMDFIQDEEHSILMSSHITGDLEKVCDYVTFLHNGAVMLTGQKDEILTGCGILRCDEKQLVEMPDGSVIRVMRHRFGCDALVTDAAALREKNPRLVIDFATLEDIMMFYVKGERL